MAIRHRTPTIFSIYMVDVLCCALGCVILLWQLYHAESEDALAQLSKVNIDLDGVKSERDGFKSKLAMTEKDLAKARKEKVQVTLELDLTREKLDKKARLALVLQQELDTLRETHAAAQALLDKYKADYADLKKKSTVTSADLATKIKAYTDLLDRNADLDRRLAVLEKELNLKIAEAKLASDREVLTAKKYEDAAARAKKLEKLRADLEAAGIAHLTKLSTSDLRIKLLEQQLESSKKELMVSGKRITDLLSLRDSLTERLLASGKDIAALKDKAERRFEGISLEGKNVVFLIDISGSMVMRDEKTPDATKWPKVVATIERVAASLADVESYQVIVFSSGVKYLLKEEERSWLKFDRTTTPRKIGDALRDLKPNGGTNLFIGLQEAFEMRKKGMETLFVFSDGLPTEGPGLTEEDAKLSDGAQSEKLAKHIRRQLQLFWNQPILGKRVSVNAIGFFFESPDVGAFLWSLARENEGSFVGMSRP